jgi:hypothetical protein
LGVGLTTLPCKKKIVEKPPRNSSVFCGEGQGLSWAVEPKKEEEEEEEVISKQLHCKESSLAVDCYSTDEVCSRSHGARRFISVFIKVHQCNIFCLRQDQFTQFSNSFNLCSSP